MDNSSNNCTVCDSKFTLKRNLYRHLRVVHQVEPINRARKFECSVCSKSFSYMSSLIRHIRQTHRSDDDDDNVVAVRKIRILCPHMGCNEELLNYKKLLEHLSKQHDVHVDYEEITFNSVADFKEWKNIIQHKTMSLYSKDSAGYRLKNGGTTTFYNCHRSYSSRRRGKFSHKINKACPSRLKVTTIEIDGKTLVTVKYWKTHHGHNKQMRRIERINNTEIIDWQIEQVEMIDIEAESENNDNLISKTELLLELVKTVSLNGEDALAIEKQLDSLIETVNKAKLTNSSMKGIRKHKIYKQQTKLEYQKL